MLYSQASVLIGLALLPVVAPSPTVEPSVSMAGVFLAGLARIAIPRVIFFTLGIVILAALLATSPQDAQAANTDCIFLLEENQFRRVRKMSGSFEGVAERSESIGAVGSSARPTAALVELTGVLHSRFR